MQKQTIKDALFWTVILFNTVLEVPDGMSMPAQIFGAGTIFFLVYTLLDKCKEATKKSARPRNQQRTKHKIHLYCKV